MRDLQCRAEDSLRGITCRSATPAETRPSRSEKRARQAPTSTRGLKIPRGAWGSSPKTRVNLLPVYTQSRGRPTNDAGQLCREMDDEKSCKSLSAYGLRISHSRVSQGYR